jgi:hypothetical protein
VFLGESLDDLVGEFWRAPADHLGVAVFFAVAAVGLIWVATGVRGARGGDRDWMIAFWAAAIAGSCLAALWWSWFPWPDAYRTLLVIVVLKGFYIATTTAAIVRFLLSVPMPGNALQIVGCLLKQRNAPLVAARPRRFFFW